MDMLKNVSSALKDYFNSIAFFRSLLRLDMAIALGSIGVMVLNLFLSLGGVVSALSFYAFLLALLLSLANQNFKSIYLSCLGYAAINVFYIIRSAIGQYSYFNAYDTVVVALFVFIAYTAYKYSLKK